MRIIARYLSACVLGALCGQSVGCYDAKELNAFLLQPRRPVSGLEYRVLPPDSIQITSSHVPEINNQVHRIRPDGKVNLPLVGEMFVAGMTSREIEQVIVDATKPYYREVDVTVNIAAYSSQKFYVMGQVSRPGPMPWTGHDTLLDALAQAQPTVLAWPERIRIVRGDQPQEGGRAVSEPSNQYRALGLHPEQPDNPRHAVIINLQAMIKSGDLTNNVLLMPNDVIYVQANPLAKVGLAIQNLLFPIRPTAEAMAVPTTLGM
jgi:protein involved in polysaccharide export with SLBB domain